MPVAALSTLLVLVVTLTGCPGGGAEIGEACDRHSDCAPVLQCTQHTCMPRCTRAPDCGDGYSCDDEGICRRAHGQAGDRCDSEVDCATGLACQIDGSSEGRVVASCAAQNPGSPAGASCRGDADCRNGTCALGRCVDLCAATRDCAAGTRCMTIPRVEDGGSLFGGCLPAKDVVTWQIPLPSTDEEIRLPVPSEATYAGLVFSAPPPQRVGASSVSDPHGRRLYRPCKSITAVDCSEDDAAEQYYKNPLRHRREVGTSVLAMQTSPAMPLVTGVYTVTAFQPQGAPGSTPAVTAVVRLGPATKLDLHFFFLDLEDHPCGAAFASGRLDSMTAQTDAPFQIDFIGPVVPPAPKDDPPKDPPEPPPLTLRSIFSNNGVALGAITYDDITNHPELDGLEIADVDALLRLGRHDRGVNIFFVRNLSPVGLQAFAPNPGPAGLGGSPRSGIVIGVDTLCYRSWQHLARLTAHEIARYMGLNHNVEVGATLTNDLRDQIADSDDQPENLMFYSELGGGELSPGQREILLRSPVLQ